MELKNWAAETAEGIRRVKMSNEEFITECLRTIFRPDVLPGEFMASDVTEAALARGYAPTDWRAVGPLMLRAKSLGMIETTGNLGPRKVATGLAGHATNHRGPAYRLINPAP